MTIEELFENTSFSVYYGFHIDDGKVVPEYDLCVDEDYYYQDVLPDLDEKMSYEDFKEKAYNLLRNRYERENEFYID